ncbi:c-type cytochrome [Burkholderia sp. F1]|uniref:c-type cytochrome n=1 Tax=Burkholderia sp. F1 TaxID=3366817 RepID=UPI003D70340D
MVRMALLIAVLIVPCLRWSAPAWAAGPATAPAPDTMEARVMGCAACHGAHGEGTDNDYFPRLAGKPAGYLYRQLRAFRDGGRKYPPMNYLLAYLPDAYLRQIADYFAAQHPPFPPPAAPAVDAQTLAHGQALVIDGERARGVPACATCHGRELTGMAPAIPGLVGLHATYISAQLGAWRYGTRRASAPDCMHDIATRLSERDITAVAAWLAAQPAPANPAPAAEDRSRLPLACGSVSN